MTSGLSRSPVALSRRPAIGWLGTQAQAHGASHAVGRSRHSGHLHHRRRAGRAVRAARAVRPARESSPTRSSPTVRRRRSGRPPRTPRSSSRRAPAGAAAATAPGRRRTGWSAASPSRRTSIVIDPPDGRFRILNDEARKRAANAVNARTTGNRPFDGPTALDLYDRCITRGLPHVIFPTIYNNTSQIVQGPGFVAIRYEMIHDARVIPLDGRPQLSSDDAAVLRRLARPLGRRHAGGRGDELPDAT